MPVKTDRIDVPRDIDEHRPVAVSFGRSDQRWLERLTRSKSEDYLAEAHFAEASINPAPAIVGSKRFPRDARPDRGSSRSSRPRSDPAPGR
jgi:carbamate kinase